MSRLATYVVLSFSLDADDQFIDHRCLRCETLLDAMQQGADELINQSGVIIFRCDTTRLDEAPSSCLIALCGTAHNDCVASYALADFSAGLWPDAEARHYVS